LLDEKIMMIRTHAIEALLVSFGACLWLCAFFSMPLQGQDQNLDHNPHVESRKSTMQPVPTGTGYHVIGRYSIGGKGSWDYISIDSDARRLYVSHDTQVEVLNADTGEKVGQISDTPGVHGIAIAGEFNRAFTSNGGDKSVTIFDTKTLTTIKKVFLQNGTDFILYDLYSKLVFPLNAKTTVVSAQTGDIAGTLELHGNPEAGMSDAKGRVYVNLADKGAVAVIDTKTLSVTNVFPLSYCTSPHSLSYDPLNDRLLIGCSDSFAALDAKTGNIVGRSLICSIVDSSAFDPDTGLIFESCAEGVISVIRQKTPDNYELIEAIPTRLWSKTMAFDPRTKKLFLPTVDFEGFPKTTVDSFGVLVVAKQ